MGKLSSAIKAGQTVASAAHNANTLRTAATDFRSADKKQLGRDAGHFAFNEGASTGKTMGKTWLKTFEVIPRLVCRGLQFILAIVAIGYYGNRVQADGKSEDHGYSPEWLFAVIVAALSGLTAVVFTAAASAGVIPFLGSKLKLLKTYRGFAWDLSLFVAWMVVFGIFAGIFLKRGGGEDERYKGASTGAMKTAVWVDLVNALLWAFSGIYGACKTFLGGKADEMTDKVGNKMFSKKNKAGGGEQGNEMKNYPESV